VCEREGQRCVGVFLEKLITSVGHPPANGSYVNFRRLASADRNYVISVSFPLSQRKLLWRMKSSVFPIVLGCVVHLRPHETLSTSLG
jgi:hypothetical protein